MPAEAGSITVSLRFKLFFDQTGNFFAAHEHAPENRAHAVTAKNIVRRHTRHEQSWINLYGIFNGGRFPALNPHRFFSHDLTGFSIEFYPGFL